MFLRKEIRFSMQRVWDSPSGCLIGLEVVVGKIGEE